MSLFIIVGIILFIGSFLEVSSKKTLKGLYFALFFGLTLMLCLRFGQGTDYFAYQYIYEYVPETLSLFELSATSSIHSEIGWKFLCALSKILGINYYTFVAIIGVITMLLLHSFIKKFCPLRITALFIAYPTLFLTYIFSGLRQALVVCFFLGVLLDLYIKKRYARFFVYVLLASLIHSASLSLLILLPASLRKFFSKTQDSFILFSWIFGVFFSIFSIRFTIFGRVFTNAGASANYVAMAERLLTYIIIRIAYSSYKRRTGERNDSLDTIMYIYSLCITLYGFFFSLPLVASRVCYFFKTVEIILLTTMLGYSKKTLNVIPYLFIYISLLTFVMLFKNLDSYISQGLYYSAYSNVWTFPYNNLFVKGSYRYSVHERLLPSIK